MTHDPSKSRPPLAGEGGGGGAFIGVLLGILLVYTPWAWAGLRPSFHGVGVAVAGGALAGLLVNFSLSRRFVFKDAGPGRGAA